MLCARGWPARAHAQPVAAAAHPAALLLLPPLPTQPSAELGQQEVWPAPGPATGSVAARFRRAHAPRKPQTLSANPAAL